MNRKVFTPRQLRAFRSRTYHTKPDLRLNTLQDAIEFVEARGFVTLWPIKGIELPSLWTATAGVRPVAAEHDDPGHITWGWKDQMLNQRRWYYGKLIRGKATFVSLTLLPNFYVLSPREADLDDYLQVYRAGAMSNEALRIANTILDYGAMDSVRLRSETGLSSTSSKSRFDRGLTELQRGLWILPIGVAEAGSWRYAFIYELLDRWFPDLPEQARNLSPLSARQNLTAAYLHSVGVAGWKAIGKVFGWKKVEVRETLIALQRRGEVYELADKQWASTLLIQ